MQINKYTALNDCENRRTALTVDLGHVYALSRVRLLGVVSSFKWCKNVSDIHLHWIAVLLFE